MVKGQMKIMQMSFMILAVFFFFVLVGLFFIGMQLSGARGAAEQLQREQAIRSLGVIADMSEFNYDSDMSFTLDEDKLGIMSGSFGENYGKNFWPVASISVLKLWPVEDSKINCPGPTNCNYYELYDNGQDNVQTYSTFVSICQRVEEDGHIYDRCTIGKLIVGVKLKDDK